MIFMGVKLDKAALRRTVADLLNQEAAQAEGEPQ